MTETKKTETKKVETKSEQKYKWIGTAKTPMPKSTSQKFYYYKAAQELKTFTLKEWLAKAKDLGLSFPKGGDENKNLGYYSSICQSRDLVVEAVK